MKTRSKIFTTADVQAILDKRKTMFREPVKPQPSSRATHFNYNPRSWPKTPWNARLEIESNPGYFEITDAYKCPYGEVGDVVYVRETFRKYHPVDKYGYTNFDKEIIEYAADNPPMIPEVDGDGWQMFNKDGSEKFIPWRAATQMPRKYARIWLEITDIKVERWRDITEEDAIAEGVERNRDGSWHDYLEPNRLYQDCPRGSFYSLCLKNHGYKSLIDNPWLWAISFKVLSTSGKPDFINF